MNTNEILSSRTFETEWDKNNFTRWLLSIAKTFKDVDIRVALSDKASLCKMFYAYKNSSVNRQKYQQIKKDIQVLQDYYGITCPIPTREEVLATQETTILYKDLDSLLKFIDQAGKLKLEDYDEKRDLLNIKAIVILGWRGIMREEIVLIQKTDMRQEAGKYFITTARSNFEITQKEYEFLVWFSTLSEYRGFPIGRLVVLKGNEGYLFRGKKPDEDKNENSITKALDRFNDAVRDTGKAIVFRYLRKNALFAELYDELKGAETPVNLTEQIKKKFNCEAKAALGYKVEYNLWIATFYKPQ